MGWLKKLLSKKRKLVFKRTGLNKEFEFFDEKEISLGDVITVGREKGSDVELNIHYISRNHGKFVYSNDGLCYEDSSRKGTWLLRQGKHYLIHNSRQPVFKGDVLKLVLFDSHDPELRHVVGVFIEIY